MVRLGILAVAAGLLAGCAGLGNVTGGLFGGSAPRADFTAPGVRAAQEAACAAAVAERAGVTAGAVRTARASSDASNRSIVTAVVAGRSGYCRVDVDGRVLDVVL